MVSQQFSAQGILRRALSSGCLRPYVSGLHSFSGFVPAPASSLSYCLTSQIPVLLLPSPVRPEHWPSWPGLSAERKPAMDALGPGLEARPLHPPLLFWAASKGVSNTTTRLLSAYKGMLSISKLVRNRSPNVTEVKGHSKPGLEISSVDKECKEWETVHILN